MSSLTGLTAQVNSMSGCAPADCCAEIAAIKSQLSTINGEIAALKAKNPKDHTQDIAKLFALLGTLQIGITSLGAEVGILGGAVGTASAIAAGAASAVAFLTAQLAGIQAAIAGLLASLAALSAAILPLIGLAAIVAGLALNAAAAQTLAEAAYALADTALKIGSSAGDQAATAILRAGEALSAAISAGQSAQDAKQAASTADTRAIAAASSAGAANTKADNAISSAGAANTKADNAISSAGAANTKADNAISSAGAANTKADNAISSAGAANTKADNAISSAGAANTKADKAIAAAGAATKKADTAINTAGAANSKADKAIAAAGAANAKADQALAGVGGAIVKSDQAITTSVVADNKSTEALDKANTALNKANNPAPPIINPAPPIIYPTPPAPPVNPGKEQEILDLLKGTRADVLSVPGALIASTQFRAAAISAAAVGACQASKPGSCPGGSADQNEKLSGLMNGLSSAFGALNNQILQPMANTVNVINQKMGSQIVGGLSAWSKGISEVVNKSQILNVLTYISVLHNAYMLSNALSQTLFSAVGNGLAALGLKDTSVDPNGTPFNIGKIVSQFTETFFVSIFGTGTVNGIKADWKKYSRIYQAAAQVMYSIQSIGHSILGALEVVGSHVSKIGNALQKFRLVGERAYSWMNPTPFFQNRFFTGLQATQEVVSQVDQVASEVLSVQETITQLGKNKEELDKSLGQEPASKQAPTTPEAAAVKAAADAAKIASASPAIPESSIPKP